MTSGWLDAGDTCFSLEFFVLFEYLQKIIFLKEIKNVKKEELYEHIAI